MHVSGVIWESVVDGNGIRTVVFASGCRHMCPGCNNHLTHDFKYGVEFTLDKQMKVINQVKNNPLIEGITLSGGDCMYNVIDTMEFIKLFKSHCATKDIWIYTGYTYEQIISDNNKLELLKLCDVLVDGRFIEEQKDLTLKFKGSANQRIIDIKKSLQQNKVVLYDL